MAQSIRVSDELYQLAQQTAAKMERSLAQQIEYWARLGLALDAQGVTSAQAMRLVAGEPIGQYVVTPSPSALPLAGGLPALAEWHERATREVAAGKRSAQSLEAVPKAMVKRMKFQFPDESDDGSGW